MKLNLIASLLVVGLLGCGHSEDQPVYDTAKNPDNFPTAAIDLLVSMDGGQLADAQSITTAFGDLYTGHSELLDNADWKAIIERLGGKFSNTADSLTALGISAYAGAGEYYQLASFARPTDATLRGRAALFATWLAGVQNDLIDLPALAGEETPELDDLIDAARYFFHAGPTHHEFYQTFLTEPIRCLAIAHNLVTAEAVRDLGQPDRELLAAAGLTTL